MCNIRVSIERKYLQDVIIMQSEAKIKSLCMRSYPINTIQVIMNTVLYHETGFKINL